MPREFKDHIFEEGSRPVRQPVASPEVPAHESRALWHKTREIESKVQSCEGRTQEAMELAQRNRERLQSSLQMMEKGFKSALRELGGKVSVLSGKLIERRVGESKLQELMDHQNRVIASLETRLEQMKKVISSQGKALIDCKSQLEKFQRGEN